MLQHQEESSETSSVQENLDPITEICLRLYPDQSDVLQATTQLQYWLNGPDPLDYINIYINNNNKSGLENFSHYHFVSLGLTDLYGDERVHKRVKSPQEPSGYGYELTLRVKKESISDDQPPKWPVKLMQALAKYTFTNGALLDSGDHVPNVLSESSNKIKHILICEDHQLKCQETKYGKVKFLQIVGCTDDELKYAQQWSAHKILDIMRQFKELGNEYLITDLNRTKSIFEMDPEIKRNALKTIKKEGSHLSFVKSNCFWKLNPNSTNQENEFKSYESIYFSIDLKSAKLLPLILKQRLEKENSFIFNGLEAKNLILVPDNFKNLDCCVNSQFPIKSNINECQLLLSPKTILNMLNYLLTTVKIDKQNDLTEPLGEKFYLNDKKEAFLHLRIISNEKIIEYFENS